jgi:hypothetical protein
MHSPAGAPGQNQHPDTINFGLLRQHYQKQLYKYFEERPGPKTLYIDPSIIKVLSFVMGSMPESLNIKQRILLSERNIFQPAH